MCTAFLISLLLMSYIFIFQVEILSLFPISPHGFWFYFPSPLSWSQFFSLIPSLKFLFCPLFYNPVSLFSSHMTENFSTIKSLSLSTSILCECFSLSKFLCYYLLSWVDSSLYLCHTVFDIQVWCSLSNIQKCKFTMEPTNLNGNMGCWGGIPYLNRNIFDYKWDIQEEWWKTY